MGNPTVTTRRKRKRSHRSPREGSVYEVKGRWRGCVSWTEPDGRQRRRYVSASTSAEARERLDELRRQLGIGALAPAGPRLTVGEYLEGWLERDRARVRPATWRSRETHVRVYLTPALGRLQLAKLRATDVDRALGRFLEEGRPVDAQRARGRQARRPISPLTARHIRATLRRALTYAVRDGLVGRNAASESAPPYVPHRPVSYLSPQHVRRLLDETADHELGPMIALAASTGLRQGELLGLRWADVDLAAGTLAVRQSLAHAGAGRWALAAPKSSRSRRTIPLPAIAQAALVRERQRQADRRDVAGDTWEDRDGLAFTDGLGRPLRPQTVSAAFQRARTAAGVPRVPFHALRHSAATLMLAEGVPLAVISEWLGHAGIAITAAHYAAIVPELRLAAASAVDRALAAEPVP